MIPLIQELSLKGKKYIMVQYGPSLTQYFPTEFYRSLLNFVRKVEENEESEEILLPVFSTYMCENSNQAFTVIGPVKALLGLPSEVQGGLYTVEVEPEYSQFSNVPVLFARAKSRTKDAESYRKLAELGYDVTVKVKRRLDTFEFLTYENLAGMRCAVFHVPNVYVAEVLSGEIVAPQAFVLSPYKLRSGEVHMAKLLYAKAGRADFKTSRYSHQVHYAIVV